MFATIIHNLDKNSHGYLEVTLYNKLIKQKPTRGATLHDKLNAIREWQDICRLALDKAQEAIAKK